MTRNAAKEKGSREVQQVAQLQRRHQVVVFNLKWEENECGVDGDRLGLVLKTGLHFHSEMNFSMSCCTGSVQVFRLEGRQSPLALDVAQATIF